MYASASSMIPSRIPRQNEATRVRSLLSVGSSMYHALPGSPSIRSSGTNTSVRPTSHDPMARMPSLANRRDGHALGLGRQEEQRHSLVLLGDLALGAGEQQDVVGDVSRGAPGLVAVDDPAAVGLAGERPHRPEHIGAPAGLREADREAQLAASDGRQEPLLLLIAAIDADRLRAGERGQRPYP